MEKWPNRPGRFLSFTQLFISFIFTCSASKLPITKFEQEVQPALEVLAPYASGLVSKAPSDDFSISRQEERANTQKCGSNMLDLKIGDSGLIQSPNYPLNYPPNAECTWWLKSENNSRIKISCDSLTTQACENEKYFDFVLLSPSWNWKTFVVLCGNYGDNLKNPYKITSTTNLAAIHFRSSSKNEFKGFSCKWTVETARTVPYSKEGKFNGELGCGTTETNRIVGGNSTRPLEFPWMVGLSFNKTWFCGGTLVSRKHILTAAHCTHEAVSAKIFVGTHDLYKVTGKHTIASSVFYEHPYYDPKEIKNDVALVELPKEIGFDDTMRPICLPLLGEEDADLDGFKMVATGWGKTHDGSKISPELNKLNVTVVDNKKCKESYGDIIKETNICAIGLEGQGTCQGDSGSALQHQGKGPWVQEGIVSFGSSTGCGTGHPNGYSRLAYYLEFIQSVTGIPMH